jgi:hypothetical protein
MGELAQRTALADCLQRGLLRVSGERPRDRRTAKERDEIAAL